MHCGKLHFYGHSHVILTGTTASTDVGVDGFGLAGGLLKFGLRGQQREEIVTVTAGSFHVLRRRRGRITDARRLPIFGLRVVRFDDPEYGGQSLAVELRGKRIEIARDLSPSERGAFAASLADALGQAGGSGVIHTETGRSLLGHLTPGEAR